MYRLSGLRVMLAGGLPAEEESAPWSLNLSDLWTVLIGGLLSAGANVLYGGHLLFVPILHRLASAGGYRNRISIYQPACRQATGGVYLKQYQAVFDAVHWVPAELNDPVLQTEKMLERMTAQAQAAILIGGRPQEPPSRPSSVVFAYERLLERSPGTPLYLLGLLGGETLRLIERHRSLGTREPNGLGQTELEILRSTDDIDIATTLLLADLRRMLYRKQKAMAQGEKKDGGRVAS